ncbi:universal stress protein [Peptoniphilus asaccharolyticus]
MKVRKILVPIDGTERSMHSLDFVKGSYDKDEVSVSIINVKELVFIDGISMSDEIKTSEMIGKELLEKAKSYLEGYDVKGIFAFGYAGDEIVRRSKEEGTDLIVMTKSTKKGLTRIIGSCTSYVLKHAEAAVLVIPE